MNKLSRFRNLPVLEKRLFFNILFRLYLVKFLLLFISFKRATSWFRMKGSIEVPDKDFLESLQRSILRASNFTYWKNKCLVNTLGARWILNKRNYSSRAFLGLRKSSKSNYIEAHAWIISGNTYLVHSEPNYEILYQF